MTESTGLESINIIFAGKFVLKTSQPGPANILLSTLTATDFGTQEVGAKTIHDRGFA